MGNTTRIMLVAGVFGMLLSSGCARTACKRICDWMEDCSGYNISDCVDDCVTDYYDADYDCRGSIREFGRCVDSHSCDTVDEKCDDEALDFYDDCSDDFSGFYKAVPTPEEEGAAAEEPVCDYKCVIDEVFGE